MKSSRPKTELDKTRLRRIELRMGICVLIIAAGVLAVLFGKDNAARMFIMLLAAYASLGFVVLLYSFAPEARLMWDIRQVEKARIAAGKCEESWWSMSAELRTKILLFEFKYLGKGKTIEEFELGDISHWIQYYLVTKYNLAQALYLIEEEPANVLIPPVKLAYVEGDLWTSLTTSLTQASSTSS